MLGQFFSDAQHKALSKKNCPSSQNCLPYKCNFFQNCIQFCSDFSFWTILPYLGQKAKNEENKNTFFSSTLKVRQNNVPLFLVFFAYFLRYGHFIDF